jgi:ABC-type antimicrobial peptide transport system ATPase subunit
MATAVSVPCWQERVEDIHQATSRDQRAMIRRPVVDAVKRIFLTDLETFDTLLITGSLGRGGAFLSRKLLPNLTGKPVLFSLIN